MSGVSWKARAVITGLAFVAVLAAAWVYLPDFRDGVSALWGDAKDEASERLK